MSLVKLLLKRSVTRLSVKEEEAEEEVGLKKKEKKKKKKRKKKEKEKNAKKRCFSAPSDSMLVSRKHVFAIVRVCEVGKQHVVLQRLLHGELRHVFVAFPADIQMV